MQGDNYCAADEENCFFFENGWEARITAAARDAFEAYLNRCPPRKREGEDNADPMRDCP